MAEQDQSLKIKSKKPNVAGLSSFDDLGVEYEYDIDHSFIDAREGFKMNGYVPSENDVPIDKSGVTVGAGVDLGQWDEKSLKEAGASDSFIIRAKPFLGLKGVSAQKKLKQQKLVIPPEEKEDILNLSHSVREYNIDRYSSYYEKTTGKSFKDLDKDVQTVIASVVTQYGPSLNVRTPNFNKKILANDTEGMVAELRNFQDNYSDRRNLEADILEGVKSQPVQKNLSKESIQQALADKGYDVGKIDGVIGPKTKRAIIQFQKDSGLKPDGVVGQKTKRSLLSMVDDTIFGTANAEEAPDPFADLGVEYDKPAEKQSFDDLGVEYDEPPTPEQQSLFSSIIGKSQSAVKAVVDQLPKVSLNNIKESFVRGGVSAHIDQMAYRALTGEVDYDKDVKPLKDAQQLAMEADPIKGKNALSQAIYGVAQMLPAMGAGMAEGAGVGAGAGLLTAATGIGAPVSIAAYGVGQTFGSLDYWRKQGAGQLYADLRSKEIPDEVAKPTAHIAGTLYGAVEFSQVDKLIPGSSEIAKRVLSDSIQKVVGKMALRYGATWAQEVGEEGLQAVVMAAAEDVAAKVSGVEDKANSKIIKDTLVKGWDAVKESALPMLLLMTPKAAVEGYDLAKEEKIKGDIRKAMAQKVIDEVREESVSMESVSTDVAKPAQNVSVNVTPEMKSAVESGEPTIDVKVPTEVKFGEMPEPIAETTITESAIEQKPAEVSDVDKNVQGMETGAGVSESKEPVSQSKPEDFKTAEEYVASKIKAPDNIKFNRSGDAVGREYHETIQAIDKNTGEVLGYVDYVYSNKQNSVKMIEVKPEYRRKGVGTALLNEMQTGSNKPFDVVGDYVTDEGKSLISSYKTKSQLTAEWQAAKGKKQEPIKTTEEIKRKEKYKIVGGQKLAPESFDQLQENIYKDLGIKSTQLPYTHGVKPTGRVPAIWTSEEASKIKDYIESETGYSSVIGENDKGNIIGVTIDYSQPNVKVSQKPIKKQEPVAEKKDDVVDQPTAPDKKEAWEMTAKELADYTLEKYNGDLQENIFGDTRPKMRKGDKDYNVILKEHRIIVERAISEGKPVPAEVLAEYPELKPEVKEQKAKIPQPKPAEAGKTTETTSKGESNTIVTPKQYSESVDRINSKLRRLSANPMLDPELWADLLKVGTFHVERGARTFADWAGRMTVEFGDAIKPHLDSIWAEIKPVTPPTPPLTTTAPQGDRIAKAASDINRKIVEQGMSELQESDLAAYTSISKKEQLELVAQLLTNDPEGTKAMALGQKPVQAGISPQVVFNAVKNKAILDGDVQTIKELAQSPVATERSLLAQKLGAAGYDNGMKEADPIKAANDIAEVRKENKPEIDKRVADLEAKLADAEKRLADAQSKQAAKSRNKPDFGSRNVIFTKERADKARESLRRKLSGLHSGIDPTALIEVTEIGGFYFESGIREFSSWSAEMVKDFGDKITPYLQPSWENINKRFVDEKRQRSLESRLTSQQAKLEKQLADNDFAKKQRPKIPETPEIIQLRKNLEKTKTAYNAAKSIADGVTDTELQIIVDMARAIYTAKDKMNPDFTWNSKQDGIEYGAANVAFRKYVAKLKQDAQGSGLVNPLEGKTTAEKYQRAGQDFKVIFNFIADNSKSILGSLDNSFHGRQGIKALTNPQYVKPWINNFIQSWGNIWTTLKGNIGKTSAINAILGKDAITAGDMIIDAVIADAYSRKNHLNGRYNMGIKVDIATGEEMFPTSLPARIPVLGRLFKASETAYEASAIRLRMDIADMLYDLAEKSGQDMNNKQVIGDINQIANEMTGRGSLGRMGSGKAINRTFFSIKNAKSNFDFLLRPFYPNQSDFARKEAAKNLAFTVGILAVVIAIAKAFDDDSTDLDPRGDMFGKIKLGNGAVIDITGGMSGIVILAARLITMTSKNSKTGIYKSVGESFGSDDGADMLVNFVTNKLSPVAGAFRDYLRQRNFDNKKPTFTSTATGLVTPIPAQNVIELSSKDESNAVKLAAIMLDGLGFGMSYRDMSLDWTGKTGKEMTQFRAFVGEDKFKRANNEYNVRVNNRIDYVIKNEQYKNLSDDDKLDFIKKEKERITAEIFKSYQFKYKQEKKDKVIIEDPDEE